MMNEMNLRKRQETKRQESINPAKIETVAFRFWRLESFVICAIDSSATAAKRHCRYDRRQAVGYWMF
jgi:hypothetical protein